MIATVEQVVYAQGDEVLNHPVGAARHSAETP